MNPKVRQIIEEVREKTFARTGENEMLDFYPVAKELGATDEEADWIDTNLTMRVMRSRGAI